MVQRFYFAVIYNKNTGWRYRGLKTASFGDTEEKKIQNTVYKNGAISNITLNIKNTQFG